VLREIIYDLCLLLNINFLSDNNNEYSFCLVIVISIHSLLMSDRYNGRLHCGRIGSSTPATRAHLRLHGYNNLSSYGVSLAEGFNVPMTVTADEADKGRCPVVGCSANLLQTCPEKLQLRSPQGHGPVVACKSGCDAFGRNHLACMSSKYSEFFKSTCPTTFTYAHGQPDSAISYARLLVTTYAGDHLLPLEIDRPRYSICCSLHAVIIGFWGFV
jgi:hypothetical protein